MQHHKLVIVWLVIGLAGLAGFGALASVVHRAGFMQQDFAITQQLHADTGGWYETVPLIIGELGRSILAFIVLEVAVWLWLRAHKRELAGLLVVVGGGLGLNIATRQLLAAPRLPLHAPFVPRHDTGFPSGHAMMATIVYGLLLYWLLPRISRNRRAAALIGVLGIVLLVGYTRIFFGEHYLSDVLGGYGLGLAWLAGCMAARELLGVWTTQSSRKRNSGAISTPPNAHE